MEPGDQRVSESPPAELGLPLLLVAALGAGAAAGALVGVAAPAPAATPSPGATPAGPPQAGDAGAPPAPEPSAPAPSAPASPSPAGSAVTEAASPSPERAAAATPAPVPPLDEGPPSDLARDYEVFMISYRGPERAALRELEQRSIPVERRLKELERAAANRDVHARIALAETLVELGEAEPDPLDGRVLEWLAVWAALDRPEALRWLEQAAPESVLALLLVAYADDWGADVGLGDEERTRLLFEAADGGDARAMYALAEVAGLKTAQARRWLERAAAAHEPRALYALVAQGAGYRSERAGEAIRWTLVAVQEAGLEHFRGWLQRLAESAERTGSASPEQVVGALDVYLEGRVGGYQTAEALLLRASAHQRAGAREAAVADLRRVVELADADEHGRLRRHRETAAEALAALGAEAR